MKPKKADVEIETKEVDNVESPDVSDEVDTPLPDYLNFLSEINPARMKEVVEAVNAEVPMATVEDLRATNQPLAQIARLFMIKKDLTREKFDCLFEQYADDTYMSSSDKTSNRNNIKRSLAQPSITYRMFERLLLICQYAIVDLAVTVRNQETSEVVTLSLKDVQQMLNKSQFTPTIKFEVDDKDEK